MCRKFSLCLQRFLLDKSRFSQPSSYELNENHHNKVQRSGSGLFRWVYENLDKVEDTVQPSPHRASSGVSSLDEESEETDSENQDEEHKKAKRRRVSTTEIHENAIIWVEWPENDFVAPERISLSRQHDGFLWYACVVVDPESVDVPKNSESDDILVNFLYSDDFAWFDSRKSKVQKQLHPIDAQALLSEGTTSQQKRMVMRILEGASEYKNLSAYKYLRDGVLEALKRLGINYQQQTGLSRLHSTSDQHVTPLESSNQQVAAPSVSQSGDFAPQSQKQQFSIACSIDKKYFAGNFVICGKEFEFECASAAEAMLLSFDEITLWILDRPQIYDVAPMYDPTKFELGLVTAEGAVDVTSKSAWAAKVARAFATSDKQQVFVSFFKKPSNMQLYN